MGRLASITLLAPIHTKITTICTYQVVHGSGISGPTTAFLKSKINDGHKTILCGDLSMKNLEAQQEAGPR
jgi:hypothetical protein